MRQVFTKIPILQNFDLKYYIQIETDTSGYAISEVLSQLTFNNSSQWHLVVFYLQKMILAKTQYKTHNGELLGIVKGFQIWQHYLKGSKHKVFKLTNHNNLCRFMNMKSLNSR